MAKFAIYYIPPADSQLYKLGSEILGYDIREQRLLSDERTTRHQIPNFSPEWVSYSQQYGFHITTAGTYEYEPEHLSMDTVIAACDTVFNSFDPANPMRLTAHPIEFIWSRGFIGLRYEPNNAFQTLHSVLCTLLPQYGTNSRSMRRLAADSNTFGVQHHMAHRTQHFFTPYIFDSFAPHLTLLNPFTGDQKVLEIVQAIFKDFNTITVESMCLVILRDNRTHYEIVHEFHRSSYPQPYT